MYFEKNCEFYLFITHKGPFIVYGSGEGGRTMEIFVSLGRLRRVVLKKLLSYQWGLNISIYAEGGCRIRGKVKT